MEMTTIFHLVPQSYHRAQPANRPYTAATFAEEGFIHCTADRDTLLQIANTFFADLDEPLLCYTIEIEKLSSPVRWEPPAPVPGAEDTPPPVDTRFPHVYGAIDRAAIVSIISLQRDATGQWIMLSKR